MAAPFLWGSRIPLPAGLSTYDAPHVTALANGTFLVVGKAGTQPPFEMKAWIYNADGSLREERDLNIPAFGRWNQPDLMESVLTRLVAVELPDGRIGIMATADERGSGFYVAFAALYSADLTPLGPPKLLAGLSPDGIRPDGWYKTDAILSLGNGDLAITYYNVSSSGSALKEIFMRIVKANGTLSDPIGLDSAETQIVGDSITDMTALSNGDIAIVVRENISTLKGYVLTPSGAGGPVTLTEFEISTSPSPQKAAVKVTALEGGGFVVTWMEQGPAGSPDPNAHMRVYNSGGVAISAAKPVSSLALPDLLSAGHSDVLALPGGGFAIAYEKATELVGGMAPRYEVHIAIFDKQGTRLTEDVRVNQATTASVFLQELHLTADGRIIVRHSQGIQIVDPRSEGISLKGTARNDDYIGTAFNDTLDGRPGVDVLNGAGGIDFVSFASSNIGVTASLSGASGDGIGDTWISIEGIIGSSHADILTGNGSAILKGRSGDDTYRIKAGDILEETANEGRDTVVVGGSYTLRVDAEIELLKTSGLSAKTSANLTGSNTANEIIGHGGKNTLRGLSGNDVLKASSGNDRLKGDAGSDKLYGGAGNDKLYGGTGTGRDVFVFDTKPSKSTNVDRIYDFNPKYDSVWLENKIFTTLGKGTPSKPVEFKADMFVKGTKAQDREDRIIYDSKTGALYYDKDGTGSSAQVKIATLSKNLKLTYHDFFVI